MYSLPQELLSSLAGLPGFDEASFIKVHADDIQVTSIRLNPLKWTKGSAALAPEAGSAGLAPEAGSVDLPFDVASPVPWSSFGYYLPQRPSFTFDPLFHAGVYYVQEASSMFLEQALQQTVDLARPMRVLDLCAAPGGKSTLLQSLLSPDSLLVSNEVIRTRVNILQQNMVKWGGVNTIITSNDPRDFQRLENYFDVIVVDAPCSGSGLFRREREAIGEWSIDNVALCRQRQQRILADCWPALREGGTLIYSTCSYSKEEDEDILDWIIDNLDATSCRLDMDASWNIVETGGEKGGYGYRFYPDKIRGEGLFIGCVQKNGGGNYVRPRSKRAAPERLNKKEEDLVRNWVETDYPLSFFRHEDHCYGFPQHRTDDLIVLQSSCYLKRAGVLMGKPAVREFIPEHDLALSTLISRQLPTISLTLDQAIQYLRKEEVQADTTHRGWALAQYRGQNLGWVKVLPNRINNYYPKEWRILKRDD